MENDKEDREPQSDIKLIDMFISNGSIFAPKPNIADMLTEDMLLKIGRSVKEGFEADEDSMEEWLELVDFGLNLAQQETKAKSTPWDGASNYKSPELMNAALKFSDRASTQLLKDYELLKTKVIGKDPDNLKSKLGERVSEFQNWQLNVEMEEWRDEHEKLLYDLPYVGACFKKTFFNSELGRNDSRLITYPNFAVDNQCTALSRLRRFSETHEFSRNEVEEKQRLGIWSDTDIDFGETDEDREETEQDKYTAFIEQQGFYDIDEDGYEEPYTFVVHKNTGKVVRIIPRFEPQNVLVKNDSSVGTLLDSEGEVVRIKPDENITKYGFVKDPQGGFLDVGYTHLLSALVSGINATTNQLTDAGTLSNRQGGWLSKEFRRKMGSSSFKPGEFKQTGVSATDLQNGIVPLPIKEPSPTLLQLNRFMIDDVQQLAASTDLKGALGMNTPVGTTLALIDEQLQSTGAVVKRIYRSMSQEFKKLYELNSRYLDPQQYLTVLDDPQASPEDFNVQGMDIVPTANPEIATKTQRIIMAQAELSQIQNVLFAGGDARPIIKNFFDVIGSSISEEVFPEETPDQQLQRLLAENPDLQALITGEQERLDLIAAAQADALEREQSRQDAELASKLDKEDSEVRLNKAKEVKTYEEAESEETKNQIDTYTAAGQLDNQALQNQQIAQQLNQPSEVTNEANRRSINRTQ